MPYFKTAAIVLAAGSSNRFMHSNKLLEDLNGSSILQHSLHAVNSSTVTQCILVTGHEAVDIESIAKDYPVQIAHNPDYRLGMGTSIALGVSDIDDDIDAAVIVLGDMPDIDGSTINKLIDAFDPGNGFEICLPTYRGRRGNPVLWGRRFFSDLSLLEGDVGGKRLIRQHEDIVKECECSDEAIHRDIDTRAELAARKSDSAL